MKGNEAVKIVTRFMSKRSLGHEYGVFCNGNLLHFVGEYGAKRKEIVPNVDPLDYCRDFGLYDNVVAGLYFEGETRRKLFSGILIDRLNEQLNEVGCRIVWVRNCYYVVQEVM